MAKIDEEIKRLCEEKGLAFKPWEYPRPWEVSLGPIHPTLADDTWYPKAQELRRQLIAEIKHRRAAAKGKTKQGERR